MLGRVLIVFPTTWDRKQLAACQSFWQDRFEMIYTAPEDADCPYDFDVFGFIERTVAKYSGQVQGVFSSSDYPGATVAALLAERLGLPGSNPACLLAGSHKYYSRLAQQEAAPEATPWFELIDPRQLEAAAARLRYPCFVKPVKGAFSLMSRRVDSAEQLVAFLSSSAAERFLAEYVHLFDRLVTGVTQWPVGGRFFLAEELLHGELVTAEGYVTAGEVHLLGIVDAVLHSHAPSFARFQLPSRLPAEVQARMADIVRRVIRRLGLSETVFNVELIYERSSGRISIIEVNPRICGQFADLYQKVLGVHSYEIALALATAQQVPPLSRQASVAFVAASLPWRVFQPSRVERAPGDRQVRAVEERYPGLLVWPECQQGEMLNRFEEEDGYSQRYAVVNLGADSDDALRVLEEKVHRNLGFRLVPLT